MKPGDVLFYKVDTSFVSRAIAWVEKSPYTHVALYIGDGKLIEANFGIKTRIREILPSEDFEVHSFRGITENQRRKVVEYAMDMVGYTYDLGQIVEDFFRLKFGLKLPYALFEAKNKAICSDIIDIPAYSAGIKRKPLCDVGDVAPSELLKIYDLPKSA